MAQASAEKLEHTESAETESHLDATERAVGKYARAAFFKRKINRARCSKHQIVRGQRVQISESPTLAKKREIRARA